MTETTIYTSLIIVLLMLTSCGATWGWILLARHLNWADTPNQRSSHHIKKATSGGIIFSLFISIYYIYHAPYDSLYIIGFALLLSFIGLIDDVKPLPSLLRLLTQAIIAMILTVIMPTIIPTHIAYIMLPYYGHVGIIIILIIWWLNVFNFMDGIDGIAITQALYMLLLATILYMYHGVYDQAMLIIASGAILLGFTWWNWAPARVFMGDCGSLFLAFFTLIIFAQIEGYLPYFLMASSLFMVDGIITLGIRLYHKRNILSAHREHLYQLLAHYYGHHAYITLTYIITNIIFVTPSFLSALYNPKYAWLITIILYSIIATIHGVASYYIRRKVPAV